MLVGEHHSKEKGANRVCSWLSKFNYMKDFMYLYEGSVDACPGELFKSKTNIENRNLFDMLTDINKERAEKSQRPIAISLAGTSTLPFWTHFPRVAKTFFTSKKIFKEVDAPTDYVSSMLLNTDFEQGKLLDLHQIFRARPEALVVSGTPINEFLFMYNLLHVLENKLIVYHVGADHSILIWKLVSEMALVDQNPDVHLGINVETLQITLNASLVAGFSGEFDAYYQQRDTAKAGRNSPYGQTS